MGIPLSPIGGGGCGSRRWQAGWAEHLGRHLVQVGEAGGPQMGECTRVRQAHTCTHCTALMGRALCMQSSLMVDTVDGVYAEMSFLFWNVAT